MYPQIWNWDWKLNEFRNLRVWRSSLKRRSSIFSFSVQYSSKGTEQSISIAIPTPRKVTIQMPLQQIYHSLARLRCFGISECRDCTLMQETSHSSERTSWPSAQELLLYCVGYGAFHCFICMHLSIASSGLAIFSFLSENWAPVSLFSFLRSS